MECLFCTSTLNAGQQQSIELQHCDPVAGPGITHWSLLLDIVDLGSIMRG